MVRTSMGWRAARVRTTAKRTTACFCTDSQLRRIDNLTSSTFPHQIRYTRKLGAPLGPAKLDSRTGVLSRHFESGTTVTLGPSKANMSADSLGFFSADINNVAGEITQPNVRFVGKFSSPLQCESICSKEPDCLSYTWCGPTKGGFAENCYLRNDTVWQVTFAHRGTTSGTRICNLPIRINLARQNQFTLDRFNSNRSFKHYVIYVGIGCKKDTFEACRAVGGSAVVACVFWSDGSVTGGPACH